MALVVLRSSSKPQHQYAHPSNNTESHHNGTNGHRNDSKPRYCHIKGRKSRITALTTIIVLCIIIANFGYEYITTKGLYYYNNNSSIISRTTNNNNYEKDPKGRTAVAALISNDEMLENFCFTVKSLAQNHIIDDTTSVLVFHEEELPMYNKKINLMKCASSHPMIFERIQFTYPEGYRVKKRPQQQSPDDMNEDNDATLTINDKWSNHRTIFWTTVFWDHPLVLQFETIMRINPGSCFVEKGIDATDGTLPGIPDFIVYRSHGPIIRPDDKSGGKLINFAQSYMDRHSLSPSNPELWSHIKDTYAAKRSLPVFHSDFEVIRVSFVRRPDVRRWHETIALEPPYRSVKNGWKDYQIRVVTMAMFAEKRSILLKKHHSYVNLKHVCLEKFGDGGGREGRRRSV